jgi:predicted metal-dependent HD superfamily phosphohydrolase
VPARALAERPAEVELALWFHDAIYDTRAADSEERSAAWARASLARADAEPAVAERVAALVLATEHAVHVARGDAALLVDVDLSILGAAPARFDEYEAQVRREYAWVPEPGFRAARAEILAGFLARPRIFTTEHFFGRLETPARANLARSLARLRG